MQITLEKASWCNDSLHNILEEIMITQFPNYLFGDENKGEGCNYFLK